MTIDLTTRVHATITWQTYRYPSVWDISVSSYVESITPFRGYWFSCTLGAYKGWLSIYIGE